VRRYNYHETAVSVLRYDYHEAAVSVRRYDCHEAAVSVRRYDYHEEEISALRYNFHQRAVRMRSIYCVQVLIALVRISIRKNSFQKHFCSIQHVSPCFLGTVRI
jgi:hypothetical protein